MLKEYEEAGVFSMEIRRFCSTKLGGMFMFWSNVRRKVHGLIGFCVTLKAGILLQVSGYVEFPPKQT